MAASLALHAGAAAAVAATLAWRAAPVAPPPDSALQVVWLDARPLTEPDPAAKLEPQEPPPRDAYPSAAPAADSAAEGLEPEDALATMLLDPAPQPPSDLPARAEPLSPLEIPAPPEAPPPLERMAVAESPAPELPGAPPDAVAPEPPAPPQPAPAEDRAPPPDQGPALAALAVPPPAPSSRADAERPSPAAPTAPARRERSRPAPQPRAPVARPAPPRSPPPAPAGSSPRAESTAPVPSPSAAVQAPLLHGPPRFRRPPAPPDYPAQAQDRGEEGAASLRLLVGADGATREIRLHRSSGNRLLDEAALAAARRWEIEPASLDGRRAEAWVEVPVRFRLDR